MKKLILLSTALTLVSCEENNRLAEPQVNPFNEVQVVKTPSLEGPQEISQQEFAQTIAQLGTNASLPDIGYSYLEDQYLIVKTEGNDLVPFIYCHFKILKEKTLVKVDLGQVYQHVQFERKAINPECARGNIEKTFYIQQDRAEKFGQFDMDQFNNGLNYTFRKGMNNRALSMEILGRGFNEDNIEVSLRSIIDSSLSVLQPIRFQSFEEKDQMSVKTLTNVLDNKDPNTMNLNGLPIMKVDEEGEATPTGDLFSL